MSKKNDTLEGFEDFAEALKEKNQKALSQNHEKFKTFELYSFLEEEMKRLKKMDSIIEETTYILKNFPHGDHIIQAQLNKTNEAKTKAVNELASKKAMFWKSINETFSDFFS
ncbi:MAG: hypothetical protein N4A33_06635 [Bacteriovoracaceae bacterium]|jgi:hypothetical protein|nr:hypothetical protein [Bacteriovoracaceae bacterium]